jgi:hypothetical protein
MNIIDKLYYFTYCTITGGSIKPVEVLGNYKVKYHPYAYQIFLIMLILYTCDFVKYTGLTLLIKDFDKGNAGMYWFLGTMATIAICLYWYLSGGKDEKIVAYYNGKRVGSKTRDTLTPLFLILLAFIILGVFRWLQGLGLPLPLLKYFC